jgi:hypothetical protein
MALSKICDLFKTNWYKSRAREAFETLRPSCQRDYAARVAGATTPEQRERLVKRVVELALAWEARHPNAGRRALPRSAGWRRKRALFVLAQPYDTLVDQLSYAL